LFALLTFTLYIFYFRARGVEDFIIIPYLSVITATFLYLFQTYPITQQIYNQYEIYIWVLVIILIIYVTWKHRTDIKKIFTE